MPVTISPNEMQRWIDEELAEQPDIGLRKTIMNVFLERRSPFDPRARRKPKVAFLLGAILFVAAAICFCNFIW